MDFNNHTRFVLNLPGGEELWVTETTINTWIVGAVLLFFALIIRFKARKFNEKPSGFQNAVEAVVEMMDNYVKSSMSEKYYKFGYWFFGVMAFIMAANLSGLVGLRPPTADLATTGAFAIITFLTIHVSGIVTRPKKYLKGYFEPFPIFFPINLIGEIATPVSLGFRLLCNILLGFMIMGLIYSMFPWFLKLGIPAVLHVYFDIFAGCLQAFIFVTLSMTFIREKLAD